VEIDGRFAQIRPCLRNVLIISLVVERSAKGFRLRTSRSSSKLIQVRHKKSGSILNRIVADDFCLFLVLLMTSSCPASGSEFIDALETLRLVK
jgi:hypothetical protein